MGIIFLGNVELQNIFTYLYLYLYLYIYICIYIYIFLSEIFCLFFYKLLLSVLNHLYLVQIIFKRVKKHIFPPKLIGALHRFLWIWIIDHKINYKFMHTCLQRISCLQLPKWYLIEWVKRKRDISRSLILCLNHHNKQLFEVRPSWNCY